MLNTYQSCIVNTVHDSIVIDVHPEEVNDIVYTIKKLNANLVNIIKKQFNVDFNVPLLLDIKIGNNWLDTHDLN